MHCPCSHLLRVTSSNSCPRLDPSVGYPHEHVSLLLLLLFVKENKHSQFHVHVLSIATTPCLFPLQSTPQTSFGNHSCQAQFLPSGALLSAVSQMLTQPFHHADQSPP